eukprot:COSAG02_NODE_5582_length_4214_cov_17.001215_3_plen_158_part_00
MGLGGPAHGAVRLLDGTHSGSRPASKSRIHLASITTIHIYRTNTQHRPNLISLATGATRVTPRVRVLCEMRVECGTARRTGGGGRGPTAERYVAPAATTATTAVGPNRLGVGGVLVGVRWGWGGLRTAPPFGCWMVHKTTIVCFFARRNWWCHLRND